ncbi:MAG TPA: MFS transporter [Anaerolineae bacterium]
MESKQTEIVTNVTATKKSFFRLDHLTSGFHALSVRNFRLYWIGQLISLIGTWMQTTAQSRLVYQLTNSAFALGLVTTLQFLPVMLFSLFGGVMADRVHKRNLMVITQTAFLIQATIFGILVGTGAIQIWHVYILAIVQGVINAVDNPVRQALPVELVGHSDVSNAVALNSMLFNAGRIVGPAVAGIIIASAGIAPALYINAASFVAVIVALLMMNPAQFVKHSARPRQHVLRELREGLSYARRTPTVITILLVICGIGTFGYNFSTVLPLLAGFVIHTNATGFGALSTALGIGSFIGATFVAYNRSISFKRLFIGSSAFILLLGLLSQSNLLPISESILIVLGFAGILFTTTANTLLQTIVPDELRGRVMGIYVLLFVGSTPVGAFFTGTVATAIGVSPALLVEAVICAISLVVAGLYYGTHVRPRPLVKTG